MQFLWITLFSLFLSPPSWETDFQKAQQSAQAEHKFILINFSGSDWCGPCIRMHKEVFDSNEFTGYAGEHLVLVNADFPRLKKHQLPADQQKRNDQLAEAYNEQGIFPLTLLLSPDGKILKKWEGFPSITGEAFTHQVKTLVDGEN